MTTTAPPTTQSTTAYKVVRRTNKDKLISAIVGQSLLVHYDPGEKTSSKWGPVLVFDSLGHARFFLRRNRLESCGEIWECSAANARPAPFVACATFVVMAPVNVRSIAAFWTSPGLNRSFEDKLPLPLRSPPGTLAADSITLVRKIYPA